MTAKIDGGAVALPITTPAGPMSLRAVNWAMAALTMSLFTAAMSNMIVLTALPRIVADLHGNQASYTWIVTGSMLTMTVCMPIWGRISDLVNKKLLIQLSVLVYVLASMCAGLAGSTGVIIACRVVIGLCASGIIVLMQAIAAEIATPRHRARWIGYQGAVISVATVGAPALGGFIAEQFGWRWCFFLAIPIAILSITMLQRTLRLPVQRVHRDVSIDWAGAALVAISIVTLVVWLSILGPVQGWSSLPAMLGLAAGLAAMFVCILVERRMPVPILPLDLLVLRDVRLGVIAAYATGFAFFGSAVFLAIFLQVGRGFSPQVAGLMALPEAMAALLSSLVSSRFIARSGRYRRWMIGGASLVCVGFMLLATVDTHTGLPFVGLCVALIGGGLGMVSENLVLVVQTAVNAQRVGAAGALVNFFRMAGGISCVAGMGALLSWRVALYASGRGLSYDAASSMPDLSSLPLLTRTILETAYAQGVATIFLACVPVAATLLSCVFLLRARELDAENNHA